MNDLFENMRRRKSLMARVLLILFATITALILVFSVLAANTLYDNAFDDAQRYSGQLLNQTANSISSIVAVADNIATVASRQPDVLMFLLSTADPNTNSSVYYTYRLAIRDYLTNLCLAQENVACVTVISDRFGFFTNNGSDAIVNDYDFRSTDWYKAAAKNPDSSYVILPHIPEYMQSINYPVLSIVYPVNMFKGGDIIGEIIIDLKMDAFKDVCGSISLGDNGYAYIIDKKGEYVYRPSTGGDFSNDAPYNTRVLKGDSSFVAKDTLGNENVVFAAPVDGTEWNVVGVSPYGNISGPASELKESYILLGIGVAALLAAVMFYFLRHFVFARLDRLKSTMAAVTAGDLSASFSDSSTDEIGELGRGFNTMVNQIHCLIDDVTEKEKEKRDAQLAALQAQINPHFLYNTLDSIVWMAESDPKGAADMAYYLAMFFRLSIAGGNDIVPLKQEFEQSRSYLRIQAIRYESYFDYELICPDELAGMCVPKLIIQPLIENSIYHGIKPCGHHCHMVVSAEKTDGGISIYVKDDGIGMDEETLKGILLSSGDKKNPMSGIGVKNVDMRIRLMFGENSGLRFSSEPGRGTTAEIFISETSIGC